MTENLAEDLDELARELDRAHVFHSWSAQAQLSPLVIASGRGCRVWDHAGREYLDFSSQLVNVNIGHQHPAVVAGDPRAGRAAHHHRAGDREPRPRRGRQAHHRPRARRASTRCSSPTAAPTPTRTRSGWPACTPAATRSLSTYRSYHGNTGAAIVVDGRLAPHPQRVRARPRALLRPLPLPLRVLGDDARAGVRARAAPPAPRHRGRGAVVDRGDPARDHPRHRGHPAAAARLPRGRARAGRPARHPAHPRRGDGRVRPHAALVRVRRLRRACPTSSPSPRA